MCRITLTLFFSFCKTYTHLSYLPGQEAGNVDIVLDAGFGDFCKNPSDISEEVACWLQDDDLLELMSECATKVGAPNAASDIVLDIGEITQEWLEKNEAD